MFCDWKLFRTMDWIQRSTRLRPASSWLHYTTTTTTTTAAAAAAATTTTTTTTTKKTYINHILSCFFVISSSVSKPTELLFTVPWMMILNQWRSSSNYSYSKAELLYFIYFNFGKPTYRLPEVVVKLIWFDLISNSQSSSWSIAWMSQWGVKFCEQLAYVTQQRHGRSSNTRPLDRKTTQVRRPTA